MARVLIVEPDADTAAEIVAALDAIPPERVRLYGTKPCVVPDVAAGLAALHEGLNWELVVASVAEAAFDGWALVRAVRERFSLLDVPVIVIAPYRSSTVEMEAMAVGVNLWLPRPVHREELGRLLLTLTMCEDR